MPDHERAMLAYVQLADLARRKRQGPGQEKFLILAAVSALRAGWPDVAERCRAAVVGKNPNHLLAAYDSMSAALRDDDFAPFLRRIERFCPFEKAETLLDGLGLPIAPELNEDDTVGAFAARLVAAALAESASSGEPDAAETDA